MTSAGIAIICLLAFVWLVQYGLTYLQMRRYYGRLAQLRRLGLVSVGMAGSVYKRRQYAVLVVNRNQQIVCVEQLSGWTVLANLRPVPGLAGRPVSDLTDDSIELPVSRKLLLALRDAVKHYRDATAKAAGDGSAQSADRADPAATAL